MPFLCLLLLLKLDDRTQSVELHLEIRCSNQMVCCAKMPEKSRNCLGSVNRAVDRVVCHPAALGWHRRATDNTLPGTELCFYQLSGQRPPPDCIGDKQEERGLLAPPLGNRDIYEERMGPTWCMDAGPRLLGNGTTQTIVWSWKCTATAFQTLAWLLRRLSCRATVQYSPYKYD